MMIYGKKRIGIFRVGILRAKTYFYRDIGKNRFLPVFAGYFQNTIEFSINCV